MKSRETHVPAQTLWCFLWFVMLIFSGSKACVSHPIFSSNLDLGFSALLATVAGLQMSQGVKFLRKNEAAFCAILLVAFCAAQLLQFSRSLGPPSPNRGVDFSAYYIAANVMSEKPAQSIYQLPLFPDGRMNLNVETPVSSPWHAAAVRYHVPFGAPYIYPPFVAILMKLMAHLSFASAYLAWSMLTILLVVAAVFMSLSVGGVPLDRTLALLLGVGLFSYYPFLDNLFFGQIGGVILFLLAAGVWLLSKNRVWSSALCFAVATVIKLTPVLAVPILIFHRRWKWLMAYVAWMIFLLVFSVWQAGWTAQQQFWREVMPSISSGAPVGTNLSIMAFVQDLFLGHVPLPQSPPITIPPHAAAVSRFVALLVYFLMLGRFYLRRRDEDLVRDLVIMVLLEIVISPISWTHHYLIALLPFLYLWCKMPAEGNRTLLALFIAVGINVVGVFRIPVTNSIVQLILAGIIPGLTLALAYVALAPRQKRSAGPAAIRAEVHGVAHGQS